jgi:molybdopterin-guanine dinucleotide biosynthesis protein A
MENHAASGGSRIPGSEGAGVVLAGGTSRRLGRDKRVVTVGGRTLLERVAVTLQNVFERVLIVTRGGTVTEVPETVDVVHDRYSGSGPVAGIHAALIECAAPHAFVAACDMPFLSELLIRRLFEMVSGYDAVVPRAFGRAQPLHAVYASGCAAVAERLLLDEVRSVESLLGAVRVRYVDGEELRRLDPDLLSFFNVNTEDDLAEAEKRAASLSY